jgi:hypothetical protein
MRILQIVAAAGVFVLGSWGCGSATLSSTSSSSDSALPAPAAASDSKGSIAGFAFVDSAVTSQGSRAKLPSGTKIYPPGSTVTGTDGCPTTQYRTDGQPVVVIDYDGRPTAGSVQVTRHPAAGGNFEDAPYYLDVNPGRTVQNLGPIFDNGSYDVVFTYDFSLGKGQTSRAKFVLARSCGSGR